MDKFLQLDDKKFSKHKIYPAFQFICNQTFTSSTIQHSLTFICLVLFIFMRYLTKFAKNKLKDNKSNFKNCLFYLSNSINTPQKDSLSL